MAPEKKGEKDGATEMLTVYYSQTFRCLVGSFAFSTFSQIPP